MITRLILIAREALMEILGLVPTNPRRNTFYDRSDVKT